MMNIKIDITTLRKKLRKDYKYDEMAQYTGIPRTVVFNTLNKKIKHIDTLVFVKLCMLADVEPMSLIIEEGEN